MIRRLRRSNEWAFFGALRRAWAPGAMAWWALLVLRSVLPPVLGIAIGWLVGNVQRQASLTAPLIVVGVAFVVLQTLPPFHQVVGATLGARTGAYLNDRLLVACTSPPGIAHLENPGLINDLTMARDFDLGITGPPLHISMDFIASGLVELLAGIAAALVLFAFRWWAPLLILPAWGCTHWLLRESGVWKDRNTDEVRNAQRHADYAFRLAVDPPAAKELRLFGLSDWVVERFAARRRQLYELQWKATKLREKSVLGCLAIVLGANVVVLWVMADAAANGALSLAKTIVFMQATFASSAIAFGGLSWALDGASAPVAAVMRLESSMAEVGALHEGALGCDAAPAKEIRFRNVSFSYPAHTVVGAAPEIRGHGSPLDDPAASLPSVPVGNVLDGFDLTIPAGTSMAIVGVNGAGKTTLAKLLCRLYDPTDGSIEIDGVDLREIDVLAWRKRVAAVFQDFVRYERPLRDNVAPTGAPDAEILSALTDAGAERLAGLDTILARGYPGGTDLSGGQWQRVALARALCSVRLGAGVVLLDEPTAQLDVRGESEIFERVLAATRHCTTVLISHRFSTVRLADRICVVEHGRVVELGSHDELIALGGRYKTMFELQASRFVELDDKGEEVIYASL